MPGSSRLSQRIAEGDGIAIIVRVEDADGARAAEQQGAKAVAVAGWIEGIRAVTSLPLLWIGAGMPVDADAMTVRPDSDAEGTELETVVDVRDEDDVERALERHDPEIFLLSPGPRNGGADPLEAVLELLPDVPAGKLAIADVAVRHRDDVLSLERAGIDAVLVPPGNVAGLVGERLPDL